MKPEVSVVMPVRNVEHTIDVAVRSIVAQSLQNWELVVLDDGSTDGTVALLEEWAGADPRIHLHVDGQPRGISSRLNQGVELCRAPLVARMDGDDVSYPSRLETQAMYLRAHPDVDLVGAGEMSFRSDGTPRGARVHAADHAEVTTDLFHGIPLSHPTWMGRRSWFVRHPYDAGARGCEDQELLLRAHRDSRYVNLPDVLLGYREDRIKLKRSVDARMHQGAFLVRYGMRHGRLLPSISAAVAHAGKAAVDAVAVLVRREEWVMTRRTGASTEAEREAWATVWAEVAAPSRPPHDHQALP